MPLQLYDKEKILDTCLTVFARHGYENTSVAMLAEAARNFAMQKHAGKRSRSFRTILKTVKRVALEHIFDG